MPVTKVGIVYYQDDPQQRIFRIVYPQFDDSELDSPQWTTLGCDAMCTAVLAKCAPSDPRATAGTIGMPLPVIAMTAITSSGSVTSGSTSSSGVITAGGS